MKLLVSIVIPLYNGEKYIKDSIESCINQTYPDIEVIVVNDGSTDNSEKVVMNLKKQYSNITYLNSKHVGKVNVINKGVLLSKGDYIAIHAADDVCFKDRIYRQVLAIESNVDTVLVYGNCEYVDENLKKIQGIPISTDDSFRDNYFVNLINGNFVSGGTILLKAQIKDKIFPIPEKLLFEDWWIAFIASYYGDLYKIYTPLIKYRQHSSNDNATFKDSNPIYRADRIKKNYLRHFGYYDEIRRFIDTHPMKKKKEYIALIDFNILCRRLIINSRFKKRWNFYKNENEFTKYNFNQKVKLACLLILGDTILYLDQILKWVGKSIFNKIYITYVEKKNRKILSSQKNYSLRELIKNDLHIL